MAIKTLRHLRQSGALLPNFKNHASLTLYNNLHWKVKQTMMSEQGEASEFSMDH